MTDFNPNALVLRTTDKDGRSHGGFQWPREIGALVECPDWKPEATCRNGLFGYLDGMGSRDSLSDAPDALWWIVEVVRAECVLVENDKVKYPRARVAYFGSFGGALARLPLAMVEAIFAQTNASVSAAATTGYGSAAATTGCRSAAATTGNYSAAATTGDGSAAATTGNYSAAATAGDGSAAATTGYRSAAATTGNYSAAATAGDGSAAATTGNYSAAATAGDGSAAATTGNYSAAATTGCRSAAATTGLNSIAAALGRDNTASACDGGAISIAHFADDGTLVAVGSFMVGTHGVEAGKAYRLTADGKPELVA